MRHTRLLTTMVLAAAASGCGLLPEFAGDGTDRAGLLTRRLREHEMNLRWQNQPLSELRARLGEPVALLDIPGGGNPPGFVMVYPRDAATGCVDAFALMYGRDPVIRSYQCR